MLGFYLDSSDFGLYAVAQGVVSLTAILRAGGVQNYLPSLKPDEFESEAGRLLGWGLLCAILGAAVTAALAHPLAEWQLQPSLAWVLWILALRNLLAVMSMLARTRMVLHQRYRELATLDTVSALLRFGLSWTLAYELQGTQFSVLALAIPFAAASAIELAYTVPASGITMREMTPRLRGLRGTVTKLRWPLVLAIAISINSQTNIIVMKAIIPLAAIGWFFWAFLLAQQPLMMLSAVITNVFAPTMARERGDPLAVRRSIAGIFSGSMLMVPLVFFGVLAVFPAAEHLLYGGRWAPAIWPLRFLSFGMCFATVTLVLTGPLTGLRRFKALAGFEATRAAGLIGGTLLGWEVCRRLGLSLDNTTLAAEVLSADAARAAAIIAASTGACMALVAVSQQWMVMRRYGMGGAAFARTILVGPVLAMVSLLLSASLGDSAASSLSEDAFSPRFIDSARLVLTGGLYFIFAVAAIRILAVSIVNLTLEVLPKRFRSATRRLLMLK